MVSIITVQQINYFFSFKYSLTWNKFLKEWKEKLIKESGKPVLIFFNGFQRDLRFQLNIERTRMRLESIGISSIENHRMCNIWFLLLDTILNVMYASSFSSTSSFLMLQGCSELGYKTSYDKQIHVSILVTWVYHCVEGVRFVYRKQNEGANNWEKCKSEEAGEIVWRSFRSWSLCSESYSVLIYSLENHSLQKYKVGSRLLFKAIYQHKECMQ